VLVRGGEAHEAAAPRFAVGRDRKKALARLGGGGPVAARGGRLGQAGPGGRARAVSVRGALERELGLAQLPDAERGAADESAGAGRGGRRGGRR
jgi:hypothetical protein